LLLYSQRIERKGNLQGSYYGEGFLGSPRMKERIISHFRRNLAQALAKTKVPSLGQKGHFKRPYGRLWGR